MIETWHKCFDENKIVGATLTDLSKAFNCLLHDLLVVKPGGEGGGGRGGGGREYLLC